MRHNEGHRETHELGRKVGQALRSPFGRADLQREVPSLHVAHLVQPMPQFLNGDGCGGEHQHPDAVDFHRLRRGDTERRQEEADAEGHDESNSTEPHGEVLPNTRVFTVGAQRGAPRLDSGYSSADLRAIGMKTPLVPPRAGSHHGRLVLTSVTAPAFWLYQKREGYREVQPVVPGRWFASCPRSLPGILPSYFKVELYSSSLSLAWLAAWSSAALALAILPVINCSIAA